MSTPAPHWASVGENTCVFGMLLLAWIHRWLGRLPFLLCLYPVVLVYWATGALARRSSLEYLQRLQAAHGSFGREPGRWHSLRHFVSFADTLLDKMLAMGGRYPFDSVCIEGQAPLLQALAAGQGGVIVTGHVGCLELCQVLAERLPGLRMNILVHTAHAERFNRLLKRLHPHSAVQLLQVSEVSAGTAVWLSERVGRGEFVAIAGDRVPLGAGRTVEALFLGHGARLPVGPYVLSALLKCPLYFMGCVREGAGHTLRFASLAQQVVLPRARREAALAEYAEGFVQQLERLLQQAPYDWFNFFPFWAQGRGDASLASRRF
ncbi:putative LPLAT superfamily acyltransferase [Rhodoferax ferrireducens]|uniref:LPLAT superfamily acyltransferase n=1 Tax=Rhodoferax ferrireducens TaxID=192843 RepID=A0ABU2CA74_9BURK|nr:acyltransferase [Rhodoferax ferrireducens]MDR7378228.1 putative LPLAT superfamily acyltransferase [Rhodoferax ferrireducens]